MDPIVMRPDAPSLSAFMYPAFNDTPACRANTRPRRGFIVLFCAFLLTLPAAGLRAAEEERIDPMDTWEFGIESGALWRVGGGGSQLDYVILPQLFTWKTPAVSRRQILGRTLVMRSRFSALLEPFAKGPETHFVGASASGLLEYWNAARTQAFFLSSGGGMGLMDSRGYDVEGAQGQDLNFHWFVYAGSRFQTRSGLALNVGAYFQHISNTGLDKVNPGINSLGPMIGVHWRF